MVTGCERWGLKVLVATTNNLKSAAKGEYKLTSTVPAGSGITEVELLAKASSVSKIIIEGVGNSANLWIMKGIK